MIRASFVALVLGWTCVGWASDHKLVVESFVGKSLGRFLGSEDERASHGFGFGFSMDSPRWMRYGNDRPILHTVGYYNRSTSRGLYGHLPNGTDAYGVLSYARYYIGPRENSGSWFLDIGFGFQISDMETVDLSSTWSFTPTLGFGYSILDGRGHEMSISARYFHLSNAGLQGNNKGQNQLLLAIGFRF